MNAPTVETIARTAEMGMNAIVTNRERLDLALLPHIKQCGLQLVLEVSCFFEDRIWDKFPGSRPVDRNGVAMEQIRWYTGACPNHAGLRETRLQQIAALLEEFEFDGLWLDFLRYPCHWEQVRNANITEYCFCSSCQEQFRQDGGSELSGMLWQEWKSRRITAFAQDAHRIISLSRQPDMLLGMFSVPWRISDFDGAMPRIIGQDVEGLAVFVDMFTPMTYHWLTGQPAAWIHEIARDAAQVANKLVCPAIQTMNEPDALSATEFEQALEFALQPPSSGVMIFHVDDLLQQPEKCDIVKKRFGEKVII
ncbi:hypothetical protein U14_02604 [Candidatus Moduliflexus flocculans]|uniref:DUF4015 domain-containing protein n=1 Tax=Candidatus Moduliflexus flocculans TaxID=1499966 RepID=A0A081BLU5_9BACT|nr:hypothetical protein U14_02604 [Candidatus Moduliflexus flocculans]